MPRERILALDLEGTLISNAVSQFPRPGLYAFLEFCREHFDRLVLYTAVRDAVGEEIVRTLVAENAVPEWFLDVPFVSWDGHLKDLGNVPDVRPCDCLLVDDNRDYVVDDQVAQWIPIAKYQSPYPDTDRELARVQQVIVERFRRADVATEARKRFEVRSARNAEFFRSDRPWAAISISSRDDHPALDEQNRVGLLQLVFDDTTKPDHPQAFTASQAEEILAFVERMWDKVETFLIHCEIGMSRSPAVAAALSRIHYNDDGPWFEMDFPNRLVYQLLVETAARRGVVSP
jgi:predicted protein tyrosine phosphatase